MRKIMYPLLAALVLALSACAPGNKASTASGDALSLNEYNRFVQAQQDNREGLMALRREMATVGAAPQELFAMSLLIRTVEKHASLAANLADLALLAKSPQFEGSPYVRARFKEISMILEEDLGEMDLQNLALNKSAFKDISAIYMGYMNDLKQLAGLVRQDLAALSEE
jgi:hypothetical protein